MNKQTDNKIIAVYGSLRQNHGNWRALLNCDPLKTEAVKIPFRMVSLGSFPGLVPSDELNTIIIELYSVNQNTYNRIQQLEGWPSFYQKALVPTSLGEVEVYVLESPRYQSGYDSVEGGDWNKFYKRGYVLQD